MYPVIHENYKNYSPPFNIKKVISRLMKGVNPKYLIGLDSIVLTNKGALNSDRKKQKIRLNNRKVKLRESLGLYYRKQNNKKAYIEIFTDNVLINFPKGIIRVNLIKDLIFSKVLYHEIGHHINLTQKPLYKNKEMVADKWSIVLGRKYIWKKYWYLIPVFLFIKIVRKLFKLLGRILNRF